MVPGGAGDVAREPSGTVEGVVLEFAVRVAAFLANESTSFCRRSTCVLSSAASPSGRVTCLPTLPSACAIRGGLEDSQWGRPFGIRADVRLPFQATRFAWLSESIASVVSLLTSPQLSPKLTAYRTASSSIGMVCTMRAAGYDFAWSELTDARSLNDQAEHLLRSTF